MKLKMIRIMAIFLACLLLVGTIGCRDPQSRIPESADTQNRQPVVTSPENEGSTEPEEEYIPEGSMISTADLALALRKKYAEDEKTDFRESMWDVPADQEFFIDFAFDLVGDTNYDSFMDVFAVYADAEMTEAVSADWEIVTHEENPSIPEGHNRVYVRPGKYTPGRVWGSYYDPVTRQEVRLSEAGEYYLHQKDEYESWGFLKHYYLVQHIDQVTAETLERPLVTIFTLDNQLDAPQSEFYITNDGKAAFRWNTVPGAEYYLIVEIDEYSVLRPVDKVTGTNWVYPHKDDAVLMNQKFSGLLVTDDEMLGMPDDYERREASYNDYSVIAVNSTVHSPPGTIHKGENMASRLPYALAWNTNRLDDEETSGSRRYIPAIGLLPSHRAISMADGSTVYRRLLYDFDYAEVKEESWLYYDGYDDDGEFINPRFVDHVNLHIFYVIEGTIFRDLMVVTDVDPTGAKLELEHFRQLLEASGKKGGGSTETDIEIGSIKRDSKTSEDAPTVILDRTGERVFANSALSEYFALNLIAANEMIDLSEFPESADWEFLLDAFLEAMYQNPLALHIESAYSIPGTNLLIVEYRESARRIHIQQRALLDIIPEIIADIITPEMTDLEKSFAINQYLIDNSVYDWAALENAERNNFQTVDAMFNDSFTAYGILINKVGVCAGYADAFKLLADEAGLEAIIVTGYLEGILPHAWNRVNIDGHWHTVDVTNNANEFLFNAFLNLPDYAAGRLLVEDDLFMMNKFIGKYRSTDNSSEYYTVTGRFYDINNIAAELAVLIQQNGSATLRTDYDLDDEMFYEIVMEVLDILNINDLFAFYILGLIWISG